MARKVILDMDPGIDDAVALCLALADPRLEVIAVTATGGNVSPRQATRNVQAIIERIDPPRWPRIGAAESEQLLRTDARELYGAEGLGDAEFTVAELHNRHPSVKVLSEELRQAPGEITVVCSGPLSNLSALFQREPETAAMISELIVVGGSVAVGGNITAAAEFNIYCDAEAAQRVLRAKVPTTVVTLDATQKLVLRYDLLDMLRSRETRTAKLLAAILPGLYHIYRQRYGMEGVYLHDVAGVVAAMHPELFTTKALYGEVEVTGELTHGATVFDRRPQPEGAPNMDVALELDAAAVRDCIFRGLDHGE